eukprot:gnl/TRDRNA2_/TRDRNA2_186561_c0_seq1.p1 gnl/TRDRNA2_/TRDRNA2_186561_c0~~gnl/TRDRNA2_/TRDRNA2_186561_c0_seq1.p1  ORF type:complete len:192 (-),score=52.08 gnl/TRDRNA2_/TRDRNA2_186561_c0_seq1:211-786(-)
MGGGPSKRITMERHGDKFCEIGSEDGRIKRVIRETGERVPIKKLFVSLHDCSSATVKCNDNDMIITLKNGVEYCLDELKDPDKAYRKFTLFVLACDPEDSEEEEEPERDYEAEIEALNKKIQKLEKEKAVAVGIEAKKAREARKRYDQLKKEHERASRESSYMKEKLINFASDLLGDNLPEGSPLMWKKKF